MKATKSWTVSDEMWKRVKPLIPARKRDENKDYVRRPGGGRKPMDPRVVFEAIVYVLRTGILWKALPREFGSASSVHQYFLEWKEAGLFEAIWIQGLAEYDEMQGIAWSWQSIDGSMVKASLALESVGPNPTDRGKKWNKSSILVNERGVPLSFVVNGANTHDVKLLEKTMDNIVVARPSPTECVQNLCLDNR